MKTVEELQEIFLTYAKGLVCPVDKETLKKDVEENYGQVLDRLSSKLKKSGLSSDIGICPSLLDLYVNKDRVCLAYHHNYNIDLTCGYSTYFGPILSLSNFEILATRMIDGLN